MKPRKRLMLFAATSLLMALGVSGCEWNSELYDEFVNEKTNVIVSCPPKLFVTAEGEYRQFIGYNVHVDSASGLYYVRPDYEVINFEDYDEDYAEVIKQEAYKHKWEKFELAVEIKSKQGKYTTEEKALRFNYDLSHVVLGNGQICSPRELCIEDLDDGGTKNHNFDNAFLYNICPTEYGTCDLDEETKNYFCKKDVVSCSVDQDCYKAGIAGWEEGSCKFVDNNKACVATSCVSGYELKDGKCEALECPLGTHVFTDAETGKKACENDDENNCGAHGYACEQKVSGWVSGSCENAECVAKACKTEDGYDLKDGKCLAACIGTQVKCGGLCRDPLTDNEYCGATGTINTCADEGAKCTGGKVCVGGKCVQNTCSGDEPDLCEITYENGEKKNECRNVKSDDADHCGVCNYVCANNPTATATSSSCFNGVCQYECKPGYTKCSDNVTAEGIICIKDEDLLSDGNNCGGCGIVCGEGKACANGKCVQNSCSGATPDLCVVDGQNTCKNTHSTDADHCGACNYACVNNPATNATSSLCEDGVCQYTCDSGYTNCGGSTASNIKCVKTTDMQTDGQNCGSCGKVCGAEEACVGGKCVQNSCSGDNPDLCVVGGQNVCRNVHSSDADHCGACNYACADNPATNATSSVCQNGVCQYTCDSGYTNCGGVTAASINCIKTTDLQTDGQNCGSCGTVCGSGKACVGGKCVQNSCSGATPDLCVVNGQNICKNTHSSDASHCGACNYACSNNPATNATSNLCKDGVCQYTCNSGYTNCGGVTASSIKCIKTTDLQTDGQNCGSCGNVCGAGKACVGGKCVQNSCSGNTPDLCVVDGQNTCKNTHSSDALHCGACNYACSNNPATNAASNTCKNGVCQYACNSGYTNCGGVTASSINCIKTTDLQTDGQNCGSCGNTCGAGKACVGGKCVQNSCSGATPNLCVVNNENVCKNTSGSDASHCGACNYACSNNPATNATSNTCKAGVCQYTCNSGYTNCGGVTASSINCIKTTDLQTDGQNCGSCGNVCGVGKACVGGKCVQNSCSGNTPDLCVVNKENVCKNIMGTDALHCGACNYACANNPVANATSNACKNGVCQYVCNSGYTNCGGVTASSINCIKTTDLQTDGQNCGSCGNVCQEGKACVGGKCVQNSCSGNTPDLCVVNGQNVCKNISGSDVAHCGACNYACSNHPVANATSNSCNQGVCQYTCNSAYTNCGGDTASSIQCIKTADMQTDGQNCGSCGIVCQEGKACVGGKCVQNSCSGNTPDLCVVNGQNVCKNIGGSDAAHCGACNYVCANNPVANATSKSCNNGECQYTCNEGYTNCGGMTASSINCIKTSDLQTDGQNCGSCGIVCQEGKACVGGKCVQNSCSGVTPDLCVVNGQNVCKNISGSDAEHCGACNYACANNPIANATSNSCLNGVCQYSCNGGYTNCGGDTAASINCVKTTALQTDVNNCGACGNVCGPGNSCVSGKCEISVCSGSTPDLCIVEGKNVCKNVNASDAAHCGACNYNCANHPLSHATSQACDAGECVYDCVEGYTNCGGGTGASQILCLSNSLLSGLHLLQGTCACEAGYEPINSEDLSEGCKSISN